MRYIFLLAFLPLTLKGQNTLSFNFSKVNRLVEVRNMKGKLVGQYQSIVTLKDDKITFKNIRTAESIFNPEENRKVWLDTDSPIGDEDEDKLLLGALTSSVKKKVTLDLHEVQKSFDSENLGNKRILRLSDNQSIIPFNNDFLLANIRFQSSLRDIDNCDTLYSNKYSGVFFNCYNKSKKTDSDNFQIEFTSNFILDPINKDDFRPSRLANGDMQLQQ